MHRQDTEEQTEEEYKRDLERQTLNRLRNFLCDHLEPERFFPYLQTKEYLDPESCEQIRSAGTTKSRVNKMLDTLIRSGPRPLKVLIRAIERNGPTQKFVTDKMNGEYLKISNDPSNIERLAAIRTQPIRGPTGLYVVEQNTGQPPPYEPPANTLGISHLGFSYPPSSFDLERSSVGSVKTVDLPSEARRPEQLLNVYSSFVAFFSYHTPGKFYFQGNFHPTRLPLHQDMTPKPFLHERHLPNSPSETPDSLARLPSSFHTADFPPSYDGYSIKGPGPYFGANSPSQIRLEILSHQYQKERKISLNVTAPEPVTPLSQSATNAQEKELSKYNSLKTDRAPANRWAGRPRRVPSEHDASVVTSRSSPTNASSPTPISPGNSENTTGSATSPKPLNDESYTVGEAGTPTRMHTLMSSTSASIQPSCFTSSSLENFDTSSPTITFHDSSKSPTFMKVVKPKSVGSLTQLSPGRQYSTQLEPIQSIEDESTENQISLSTRLPPMEHDDKSIVPAHQSDEESSSLEISTDSDVSEQQ